MQQLFNCQLLHRLSMPDNDLTVLPAAIANLINLRELDVSKNSKWHLFYSLELSFTEGRSPFDWQLQVIYSCLSDQVAETWELTTASGSVTREEQKCDCSFCPCGATNAFAFIQFFFFQNINYWITISRFCIYNASLQQFSLSLFVKVWLKTEKPEMSNKDEK